ncbi:MAG: hypothetical protein ACUVX9_06690 [Anaerolineae bacterium]
MTEPQATPPLPTEPSRHSRDTSWVGAVVLIALGLIFLAQNMVGFAWDNWWALFIFIPAGFALARAWQAYRTEGRLTRQSSGPLVGGLALTAVALILLLGLSWSLLWPVFLIIGGFAVLLGALGDRP